MKQKKALVIAVVISLAYAGSYGGLRLSKLLVHQQVSLVAKSGTLHNGRSICYTIHHEIGRGSFVDDTNCNAIKTPTAATQTSRLFYFPLVKLELLYWRFARPQYIYETICQQ